MKITLKDSYYQTLVPEDLIYNILNLFSESESKNAVKTLEKVLDIVALRVVLTNLESSQDKIAFMEICRDEYQNNSPLDWAVLKIDNIQVRLQESLERSMLALYQKLRNNKD